MTYGALLVGGPKDGKRMALKDRQDRITFQRLVAMPLFTDPDAPLEVIQEDYICLPLPEGRSIYRHQDMKPRDALDKVLNAY